MSCWVDVWGLELRWCFEVYVCVYPCVFVLVFDWARHEGDGGKYTN